MKGGWMLMAALLAATACSPDGEEVEPVTDEPQPARQGPERPAAAHEEGNYVLATVGGRSLPAAAAEQPGECRVEVVDGSLRLEAGRFAFQNRAREVCGSGTAGEPVMHAAGGRYRMENGTIVLTTDVGDAFSEARGQVDSTTIRLQQLSTDAGSQSVDWQLRREGPQLVPPPGTTGGARESEMSEIPTTGGGA